MTPLQAKQVLSEANIAVGFGDPLREAIETAIKFIEENCFEWVKIQQDNEHPMPTEYQHVTLCYGDENWPGVLYYREAYVFNDEGALCWALTGDDDVDFIPIAWKAIPKLIEYQP